jgi:hypothetical protein
MIAIKRIRFRNVKRLDELNAIKTDFASEELCKRITALQTQLGQELTPTEYDSADWF